MFLIDLKTLKTQAFRGINAFNVFKSFKNIEALTRLKASKLVRTKKYLKVYHTYIYNSKEHEASMSFDKNSCNAMGNAAMTTSIMGIICINFRTSGLRGNNHGRQSHGMTEQLRTCQRTRQRTWRTISAKHVVQSTLTLSPRPLSLTKKVRRDRTGLPSLQSQARGRFTSICFTNRVGSLKPRPRTGSPMDTLAHRVIVIHWAYQWVGLKLLAADNTTCHFASHPANGVQDPHLVCLVNPAGKALKLGFPSSSRPGRWRWSAGHTTSWSRSSLAHITRNKNTWQHIPAGANQACRYPKSGLQIQKVRPLQ